MRRLSLSRRIPGPCTMFATEAICSKSSRVRSVMCCGIFILALVRQMIAAGMLLLIYVSFLVVTSISSYRFESPIWEYETDFIVPEYSGTMPSLK